MNRIGISILCKPCPRIWTSCVRWTKTDCGIIIGLDETLEEIYSPKHEVSFDKYLTHFGSYNRVHQEFLRKVMEKLK